MPEDLYAFIQENADSVVWGSGTSKGSVGFAVRQGSDRVVLFSVWTGGTVVIATGTLIRRGVPETQVAALVDRLLSAGAKVQYAGLGPKGSASFDAKDLKDDRASEAAKSVVLELRDLIRGEPEDLEGGTKRPKVEGDVR